MTLNHRHHVAPPGGGFALALLRDGDLVGVAIAGRPVARGNDDGLTLEVTRLCVLDGVRNGCSKLYSRMRRVGQSMGYRRIITYTLTSEPGTSLRAAEGAPVAEVQAPEAASAAGMVAKIEPVAGKAAQVVAARDGAVAAAASDAR